MEVPPVALPKQQEGKAGREAVTAGSLSISDPLGAPQTIGLQPSTTTLLNSLSFLYL